VWKLAKTFVEGVVLLFAAYAFVFVPLGKHTAFEHARSVFGTPEAEDAGRELKEAGGKVLKELLQYDTGPIRGEPRLPRLLPSGASSASPADR
jgi:hypothetical protein